MKYFKSRSEFLNANWKDEFYILLEKSILMSDTLKKKLNSISSTDTLAKKMLDFFNSDTIRAEADINKIDYDESDEKLLTIIDSKGKPRKMKFGKLLTYLGFDMNKIKPYEVNNFMLHFKKGDVDNLKLLSGKDILTAYNCKNYDMRSATKGDSLNYSCMRFENAQKFLEIYTNNPNQIQCLTLFNPENGLIRGRALIWTMQNGQKFMDRIYTISDEFKTDFLEYAKVNNMSKSSTSNVILDNGGEYDYYPYIDTFHYYDPSINTLSTRETEDTITLLSTDGGSVGNGGDGNMVYSNFYGEHIEESDSVWSEFLDDYIYRHDAIDIIFEIEDNGEIGWSKTIENDEVEISYTSEKYEKAKGEKANVEICIRLESDIYVLEADINIVGDTDYGQYVKIDEISILDFKNGNTGDFCVNTTWDEDSEEYIRYDDAISIWSAEKNNFVIINYNHDFDNFIEFENEFYTEWEGYDEDEIQYTELKSGMFDNYLYTNRMFIHNSFNISDSNILSKNAPVFFNIENDKIELKNDNVVELHDGIFLRKDDQVKKCFKYSNGYRYFPVMKNYYKYDSPQQFIELYKKEYVEKMQNGRSKDISKEIYSFIEAFENGSRFEKMLISILSDKTYHSFDLFKGSEPSKEIEELNDFLNKNKFGFIVKPDFQLKYEHVSMLGSFYTEKEFKIFPFAYSKATDMYIVYDKEEYKLMSMEDIIDKVKMLNKASSLRLFDSKRNKI